MPRAPPRPPRSSMLLHPVHLKQKSLSAGRGWARLGATGRRSRTGAWCGSPRGASGRRGLEPPGSEAGGVGAEIPQPPAPRHPRKERRAASSVLLLFPPTPTPGAGARGVGLQGVWGGGLRGRVYLSISLSSPLPSSLFPPPHTPPSSPLPSSLLFSLPPPLSLSPPAFVSPCLV